MRVRPASIPNTLTGVRLALIPFLWALAMLDLPKVIGAGLIVAAVTDILDGYLARALRQTSTFGSKLDSIADTLIAFSAVGWLLLVKPDVIHDHPFLFTTLIMTAVVTLLIGWAKFRRLADLHLASGRAAGVVGYAFLIHLFLSQRYLEPLFYLSMLLAFVVATEALVIQLTRDSLDEHVASPLLTFFTSNDRSGHRGQGTAS